MLGSDLHVAGRLVVDPLKAGNNVVRNGEEGANGLREMGRGHPGLVLPASGKRGCQMNGLINEAEKRRVGIYYKDEWLC